jgi:hypothetical protein
MTKPLKMGFELPHLRTQLFTVRTMLVHCAPLVVQAIVLAAKLDHLQL